MYAVGIDGRCLIEGNLFCFLHSRKASLKVSSQESTKDKV